MSSNLDFQIKVIRAMSEAAPRIRLIEMDTPTRAVNSIRSDRRIALEVATHSFIMPPRFVMEDITPQAVGREAIRVLMMGALGQMVSRSEDNRDCILGVYAIEVSGRVVSLQAAVARDYP